MGNEVVRTTVQENPYGSSVIITGAYDTEESCILMGDTHPTQTRQERPEGVYQ